MKKNKRSEEDIEDFLIMFDKLDWYLYFYEYIAEHNPDLYIKGREFADKEMSR
tara:strand:+ start:189 stop:347 length:159 start_codon:yes stop_codon:yes gene_type:complete